MNSDIFKTIPKIEFEGPKSDNPLAFKFYNPDEIIDGKSMKEHMRFAAAFWHTFAKNAKCLFGDGDLYRPWDNITDAMDLAKVKMEANFEFCEKMDIPYFCFHDRDIAPEGDTLFQSHKNLDEIVALAKTLMKTTDVKLLWGTANLFSHPRYVHGASTSPNAEVFAYAGAQVKKAMEATKELGGQNYVFWGGREGYETLHNTDMKRELDNMAAFMHMAIDYAKEIGFEGQFLIEPKPKEPTKHQYDFDVATCIAFLKTYGLDPYFKFNIEANHATLAGHTFQHELMLARINGMLGSIDANQGDLLIGWDTDQFPTNIYDTTFAMLEVIKMGGLGKGGLNFDAKVRRGSFKTEDIFYAHISGMDAFAKGYKTAMMIQKEGKLEKMLEERYASYSTGIGKQISSKQVGLKELEAYALSIASIENESGHQELIESIINQYFY